MAATSEGALVAIGDAARTGSGAARRTAWAVARAFTRRAGGEARRRGERGMGGDRGRRGRQATACVGGAFVGERSARRQGHGDHGAVSAARTAGQIDAREAAEERAPVLRRGRHGRGGEEAAGARAMGRRRAARREEAGVGGACGRGGGGGGG